MDNFYIICVLVVLAFEAASALECYMCENEESNFMCINENLRECETGLDTCQTIVAYSDVSEKLSITKSCTKNRACSAQVNATVDTPCDSDSGVSWICTMCCNTSACNFSRGYTNSPASWTCLLVGGHLLYSFMIPQGIR